MNLMSFFARRTSAPVARERLQILLAHERVLVSGEPDLVAVLREQILALVARHVSVDHSCAQPFQLVPMRNRPSGLKRMKSRTVSDPASVVRRRNDGTSRISTRP